MQETTPTPDSPAASRSLLRSTAIAAVTAIVLLVTVVMPAEYGVDPTRVGSIIGLTRMGQIKAQLAREAALEVANDSAVVRAGAAAPAVVSIPGSSAAPAGKTDTVQITLRPDEGKEIKLAMTEGARVTYSWTTDRGVVNYDTHADRSQAPPIKYHGYAKGQAVASDKGDLVAAFDGMHGWFWRNRTRSVVTVTLTTSGDYSELKRME